MLVTRATRWLLGHRALAGIVLFASLVLAGWSAGHVQVRFQYRDFYAYPANPDLPVFDQYTKDFGDPAGYLVALVEADDVFAAPVLGYIQTLTTRLEGEPTFSHVHSLTNAKAVRGDGDDVQIGPLMPELPRTPAEADRARAIAVHSPLLARRLVAVDSRATVVLAEMRTPALFATFEQQLEAVNAIRKIVAALPPPPGARVRITGAPVVEVESTRAMVADQGVCVPLALLLIVAALFITFRSPHGVVLVISAVVVALVWTFGIFPFFKRPMDLIGSTMPLTLLIYGAVDPVFVLTRFMGKLDAGKGKDDAIVESLSELALPCFITSATTALGFASFATMTVPTLISYGRTVAIGVSLAFVTTMTVLPLLLSVLPAPKVRYSNLRFSTWLDGRLTALWRAIRPRPRAVLVGTVIFVGLAAWYGRLQHINTSYVRTLPAGEHLDAVHALEKRLSGVVRSSVLIEGAPDTMKRADVLEAIGKLDAFIEALPRVNTSTSLADLVAEVNQAFHGGDPAARRLPTSGALIAQYLAMLDPEDRADFVDDDYARTHVRIIMEDQGSEHCRFLHGEIKKEMQQVFAGLPVKATLTGVAAVGYPVNDETVIEMLLGFVIAFSIIVIVQMFIFRSIRIAAMSIIPNLIPVLCAFVLLRVLHVALALDTALFLSVCVGGLFNTTIHFAARIRQRLAAGDAEPDEIIEHTVRSVGPPAFYTASVLSLGFAIFMLSRFPGLRAFGLLSTVTLMVGFFSDMIVTAASMRVFFHWPRRAPVADVQDRAA